MINHIKDLKIINCYLSKHDTIVILKNIILFLDLLITIIFQIES
jgi:hypothetical protein